MLYDDIFSEFDREQVRYLVVGGVAVNLHGYVRLTVDLDVMVDLSEKNLLKILKIMERLDYTPRVPVNPSDLVSEEKRNAWIREKGAIVFTYVHLRKASRQLDFFLANPIDFENAYGRKQLKEVFGIRIPVASIADIIALKTVSARPRDNEDVEHQKRIKHAGTK